MQQVVDTFGSILRVMSGLGISKVRITGGEPLARRELTELIEQLRGLPGIDDIRLDANDVLFASQSRSLFEAGLARINIGLDAFRPESFAAVTHDDLFGPTEDGFQAAFEARFNSIKFKICRNSR
jgi:GTP 3',8-cyclase